MFNGHFDRIKDHHVITGGLSFNTPDFNSGSFVLHPTGVPGGYCRDSKCAGSEKFDVNQNEPVIRDIGKKINASMGQDGRIPVVISHYTDDTIGESLKINLKDKGVIDMLCKKEGSANIILPAELLPLREVLQPMINFELQTNPDYLNWNMWILVDTRKVLKGHTQRNAGFHYDGLNLSGKHTGMPSVSIYAWTNKLPTVFCKKPVIFPPDFQPDCNASIYAQRMVKAPEDLVTFPNGSILKFDGATVHCGAESENEINDRVFVRVCFTGPKFWFDRKGNTVNPFLEYPIGWSWRQVFDPSVKLKNPVDYSCPEEFKNMWDTACLGHHAFSTMYSGKKAHQSQLVQSIRLRGPKFLNEVLKLYHRGKASKFEDNIGECRAQLLKIKWET